MNTQTNTSGFFFAGLQPLSAAEIKRQVPHGETAVSRVLHHLKTTEDHIVQAAELCKQLGMQRTNLNLLLKSARGQKAMQDRGWQIAYRADGRAGLPQMYLVRQSANDAVEQDDE